MPSTSPRHNRSLTVPAVALAALLAVPVLACQVPVFRYALERWQADQFEVVILHDAPLTLDAVGRVEQLEESGVLSPVAGNFHVRTVAADAIRDPRLQQAWKQHGQTGTPLLVAMYPAGSRDVPDRVAWLGPLKDSVTQHIADSPVRQKISKKLVEGTSAVWIFVPGSDKQQNEAALETLQEQVAYNQKNLELPVQDEIESEEDLVQVSGLELRIDFSIVTLPRDAPQEQFLLSMLLNSEPDLADLDQPMAFPVIGRGRVLYGLVGKGINPETIGAACRFLVGPCSCQVKNQNPGFDLLMAKAWDMKLFGKNPPPVDNTTPKTDKPVLLAIPPGK